MKHLILVLAAALATSACEIGAKDSPTLPSAPPPSTAPASLRLLAASRPDQLVDVSAVVLTVDGKSVANVSVSFSASSGTMSPNSAMTDGTGTARAVLTPQATQTTIRAQAAGLETSTNVLATPPTTPPSPNPGPTPQPSPDPTTPLTVSINVTPAPAGQATVLSLSTQAMSRADWNFGDGATLSTTSGSTSHVYANPGSYTVSATVTDVRGRVASTAQTVTIAAPPPPPAQGMIVLLKADQPSVPQGGQRTFTATIDNLLPGETATAYRWDLDGNGTFEATTTTPTRTSAPYTTAGFVNALVAITTNMRSGSGSTQIVVTN